MSLADVAKPIRGHQAEILRDLIDRPSSSPDRLFDQLYGMDPDGGPDMGPAVLKKHVWELRRKLKPGWRIVWCDRNGVPAIKSAGCAWRLMSDPDEIFSDRRAREKERAVEEKAERERKAEEDRARRERAPINVGNGRTYRP